MFIHLHTHSVFSFLSGLPKPEELIARAKALGMTSLALTDTDRMSGLILFYKECLKEGIKPILGVELTDPKTPEDKALLLAKNKTGYADLCEITTKRHLEKEGFSFEEIFSRPFPDLFLLTNSLRLLQTLNATPNRTNLFGELLCQDQRTREQSKAIAEFCQKQNLPLAASNDVHFLDKTDWELHKVMSCVRLNTSLSRLNSADHAPATAFFRTGGEMRALFPNHGEALANTAIIADACRADLELGEWIMPEITPPAGHTCATYLRQLAEAGLEKHYSGKNTYEKAKAIQEKELAIINKLGYNAYFLMVLEIRQWADNRFGKGYRTPEECSLMRGSAANSITFFNIGASDLDPIRYNLYFERFLNEDRADPPDADLDFGWDERGQVFDYFSEKWGKDRVAVMCTFNHMQKRAAFREIAKVFGFSEEQVSVFMEKGIPKDNPAIQKVMEYAEKAEGRPRFLGQHPGGIIVTNGPIRRHVACEYSGGLKNRVITQVDMHSGTDELGLIKFDILGNGSLSVLRDTLDQLREQGVADPGTGDDDRVQNDPGVVEMIRLGRTRGIFYIESPAQIRLNKKAKAGTFEEIGITSSAVRPAGAAYAKVFVERHRAMKERQARDWEYLHPSLEAVLSETHDCLVFQEDVTRVCHDIAGLSFKKSDRIRKMMNSLHYGAPEGYESTAREFMEGCVRNKGFTPEQALELWKRVASFAGYSFCKSHSLSFARLSFKCAFLKRYFPAQFMAAVVTNRHGFYAPDVYLNEARRLNVRVCGLDINASRAKYRGKGPFLVPGFTHVKGLSAATMATIEQERERGGRYANLVDFLCRTGAGKRETEQLIRTGCFDAFNMSRPELLALLDAEYGSIRKKEGGLFAYAPDLRDALHPGLKDFTLTEKCLDELDILGFMLSGNILDILDLHPASGDGVPCNELSRYNGRRVKIFGWPITSRAHYVPDRGEMKFITVEDKTGSADIILWPEAYARYKEVSQQPGPYEIWGKVKTEWDTVSLFAERMRSVAWSPAQVDFSLAEKRLLKSFSEQYVYEHVGAGKKAAA